MLERAQNALLSVYRRCRAPFPRYAMATPGLWCGAFGALRGLVFRAFAFMMSICKRFSIMAKLTSGVVVERQDVRVRIARLEL